MDAGKEERGKGKGVGEWVEDGVEEGEVGKSLW